MPPTVTDRSVFYNDDSRSLRKELWWPTNPLATYMHSSSATADEIERNNLTMYLAAAAWISMLINVVAWNNAIAIAVWIVVCTLSFIMMLIAGVIQTSTEMLRWWTAFACFAFLLANYFATACQPFTTTSGRFFCIVLFSVGCMKALNFHGYICIVMSVVYAAVFVVFGILESIGLTCFQEEASSVHVVLRTFCELIVPLMLGTFASLQIQERAVVLEAQVCRSDAFGKKCLKLALAADLDGLQAAVAELDSHSNVLPSMSDDAISVLIDLAAKLKKSAPADGAVRPHSRSPSLQLLAAPITTADRSGSSDEEMSNFSRRRRSTRLMSSFEALAIPAPFPTPVQGHRIVAAMCLPNLDIYTKHKDFSVEQYKLLYTDFVDNCRTTCTRYGGSVAFSSFGTVYTMFTTPSDAVAAGLCIAELMRRASTYFRDTAVVESYILQSLSIVLQSHTLLGSFGTDQRVPQLTLGNVLGQGTFERIQRMVQEGADRTKSRVVVPASMEEELRSRFAVVEYSKKNQLLQVEDCYERSEDGLPMPPATGALLERTQLYALPRLVTQGSDDLAPNKSEGGNGFESSTTSLPSTTRPGTGKGRGKVTLPPEAEAAWERYDKDKSGSLDIVELQYIIEDLGYAMSDTDLEQLFDELDSNKNGSVSKQEFAAAFTNPNLGGAHVMSQIRKAGHLIGAQYDGDNVAAVLAAWQRFDRDKSGHLEYEELRQLLSYLGMPQTERDMEWLLKKLDRDGNRTVEFEEFSRLFANDTVTRQVAAKARGQTVARVINNRNSGVVFSTADQELRDDRIALAAFAEKYLTFPFFVYIAYNCGAITYNVALGEDSTPSYTNMIVDMVLDLFLVFFVFFKYMFLPREDKGQLAFKRWDVLMFSVATLDFYIDMIAILPLDFIFIADSDLKVLAYFRTNKLLLYYYLDDCYKIITRSFNPALGRAANAMLYFMTFAHLFACFLIGLVRSQGENALGVEDLIGAENFLSDRLLTYPLGLYWAIITLAGQNRGAILPVLDDELALLFVAMLVGLPMYAVVLGTIGQAVQVDDSYSKFLNKIDNLRSYFQYTRLPESIESECISYYRHLYLTTGSLDIAENPLEDLPAELSIQVVIQMGQGMLRKVPIFQDASKNSEFVHELTTKLVPQVIPPHTTIMKKGERGSNMYFITFGDFNILADNGTVVFTLKKGNFFGEIALLHNVKRTATIVSSNRFSNVLCLDKKDFDEVTATFPDCLTQVYKAAEERIKTILAQEEAEARETKRKKQEQRTKREHELNASSSDDDASRTQGGLKLSLSKRQPTLTLANQSTGSARLR